MTEFVFAGQVAADDIRSAWADWWVPDTNILRLACDALESGGMVGRITLRWRIDCRDATVAAVTLASVYGELVDRYPYVDVTSMTVLRA